MNLSDVRQEYTKNGLYKENLTEEPLDLFETWMSSALELGVCEPTAMTVSTIGLDGIPSSRVLLLKTIEDGDFYFFTNYDSDKAKELERNPGIGMNFFWPEIERQIRVKGICKKASLEKSKEYFHSRPRLSQIGAWASYQSQPLLSRKQLDEKFDELKIKWDGQEIPYPEHWGGYAVTPTEIEFWQGRQSRLHDRFRYSSEGGKWKSERLNP